MHRNHSLEAHTHRFCLDLLKDARNDPLKTKRQQNFQDKHYCTGKLFHAAVTIITIARTTHHAHLNTQITSRSLVCSSRHSLGQTTHRKAPGPIFCPITCVTKHQPVHVSRRTKTYSP